MQEHATIDALLGVHGLTRRGDPWPIDVGTLNRNYMVPTDRGPLFARRYRDDLPTEEAAREHEIALWVWERGIPSVPPMATRDGQTLLHLEAERWALYPWVVGRAPRRGAMTPPEVRAVGEMHARLHRILATHPNSAAGHVTALPARHGWTADRSLEVLARVERAAAHARAPRSVLDAIALQRALIEAGQGRSPSEFADLPRQMLHGDYHDQQVLFGGGDEVVAVVDWELAHVGPRVWELFRSLAFSRVLQTDLLENYLGGYRQHVRLSELECRQGLEHWWQSRLHSTWVYEAYFLEGNVRVASLLPAAARDLRSLANTAGRERLAERVVRAATSSAEGD